MSPLSTHPPFVSSHPLDLLHFLSFLCITPLSLYPLSVGGMSWPSVVHAALERDRGGESASVEGSKKCCDIVSFRVEQD